MIITGTTQIIIALVTGFVTIAISYMQFVKANKLKYAHEQVTAELDIQRHALDFATFVQEWAEINEMVLDLIRTTKIDRFIILKAWNGNRSPLWTTAVLQIREAGQVPVQYVHFELDDDYRQRLAEMESKKHMYMTLDDAPEYTGIGQVYRAEGVTSSLWSYIGKRQYTSSSSSVTYCSFSTHTGKNLTSKEKVKCRLIVDRLKGIHNQITENKDG